MRIVILLGSLAALLIWVLAAAVLWNLRLRDIDEARHEIRTLEHLLVEETERAMESVDLILKSVQQHVAAEGIDSPIAFEATRVGREMHELLQSKIDGVPQIEALSLVGADGRLLASSRVFPAAAVNVADRDYFKTLKSDPANVPVLTRPVVSRVSGREAMFLARRISSPTGEFLGLVLGTIDLAHFDKDFDAVRGGAGVVVTLWHKDGAALSGFPAAGSGLPGAEIPDLAQAPTSGEPLAYSIDRPDAGPHRIVAMMAAAQFPLVVTISKTFDQVLSDWKRIAAITLAVALFGTGAIVIGVWLLGRQFATFEALRVAIAERSKALAARDEAEAQLRQAQKLEAIGQLTGGIAHDFNNLLTAILGNLELLQRHSDTKDARIQRWTTNAIEAARRGAALTARLLAFSRRQPLEPQAADLAQRLNSLSDLLARTLGDGIEVTTVIEPDLWRPFVDPSGLDNAILNIALNARDAMDGRGRLLIAAENHVFEAGSETRHGFAQHEHVLISISDTGRGIAKDMIDRVFEPFFTTKPVGQGTGLGLSQVYGFVKQSGGHIALASEPNRGTTVNMYLPRAAAEAIQAVRPTSTVLDEDAAPATQHGKILVVENDETVRAYAAETLSDLGFGVVEAADAQAGLGMLRSDPDIVLLLTDLGLPGMNGRELAAAAQGLRPELDVIFITGYPRDALAERGAAELPPKTALITKPFNRAELVHKLRIVLEHRIEAEETAPALSGDTRA